MNAQTKQQIGRLLTQGMIITLLVLTFLGAALAQNNNKSTNDFNVAEANKQFDQISLKLSTADLSATNLFTAIETLKSLSNKAKECVALMELELDPHLIYVATDKALVKELTTNKIDFKDSRQIRDSVRVVKKKRDVMQAQLAACRLFSLRTEEAINAYQDTITGINAKKLATRGTPIWSVFGEKNIFSPDNLQFKSLFSENLRPKLTLLHQISVMALLVFSLLLGIFIINKCNAAIRVRENKKSFRLSMLTAVKRYIIPLLFLVAIMAYYSIYFAALGVYPTWLLLIKIIFLYVTVVAILDIFIFPIKPAECWLPTSSEVAKAYYWRTIVFISLLTAAVIGSMVLDFEKIPLNTFDILRTIYLTIIVLNLSWLSWLLTDLKLFHKIADWFPLFVKVTVSVITAIIIIFEWLGYHQFVIYMIRGFITSLLAFGIWRLALYLVNRVVNFFEDSQYMLARKLRYYLGVKLHQHLVEIKIIRFVIYAVLSLVFIVALAVAWGIGGKLLHSIVTGLTDGFTIFGIEITASRLLLALLTFSILNLLSRFFSARVARKYRLRNERDTQVAIASLVSYVGFSISLIISLIVTGINFTGLAIIAGALSVGVGLGLQNIVNNFISGIILLLEKPIKPGDRIIVGQTEGLVQKVRIRSTQIRTLAREDVIVPNLDLISQQVTNYMFRDNFWRVECCVGVSYDSDAKQVEQLLLQVAAAHPDVIDEPPHAPRVLFRAFGESSLDFVLRAVVNDANKKNIVLSDLNFAVFKIFQENNINIPFPQRDVHIKEWRKSDN